MASFSWFASLYKESPALCTSSFSQQMPNLNLKHKEFNFKYKQFDFKYKQFNFKHKQFNFEIPIFNSFPL